jgi:transposase-like protein
MAMVAVVFLLAHPLLMAWGKNRWSLLGRWNVSWPIHVGRIALLLLAIAILISSFRKVFPLEYETWRAWHNVLVVGVLMLGFVHSISMGDLRVGPMRLVWGGMFGAAMLAYGYHRFFSPYRGRRHPFEVVEVRRETHDVCTLKPGVEVSDLCRREGLNPVQYYAWKKQLLGSAARVFEDRRGRPDAQEQRREAEVQRLKNVIAEITAENLELKKGRSG